MKSKGSARWQGDLPKGSGTFVAGDQFEGSYSAKTRFEGADGANPEQLIAAAHASCFSMALANILAQDGHAPDSIETEAEVTMGDLEGGKGITTIELDTVGRVPGIDEDTFLEKADAAKVGCPVSKALAAVPEIRLKARLET